MTVRVIYREGAFIPQGECELSEGTEGLVVVASEPAVMDLAERRRLLAELVDDMRRHPLPPNSPRLTRDQMHERN